MDVATAAWDGWNGDPGDSNFCARNWCCNFPPHQLAETLPDESALFQHDSLALLRMFLLFFFEHFPHLFTPFSNPITSSLPIICTRKKSLSYAPRHPICHHHCVVTFVIATLRRPLFHNHFGHETSCNPHNNRRLGFISFVFPFGALQIFKATPTTDREHCGRMDTPFFVPSSLTRLT